MILPYFASVDVEREKSIGGRLRAFRETLQIPRTKFAFTVGCGSEQLAAYESGRARLPYLVFHHITGRYFLNPFWLALGDAGGSPRTRFPFDDGAFIQQVPPRSLFSTIYDSFLSGQFERLKKSEKTKWDENIQPYLKDLSARMKASPNPPDPKLSAEIREFLTLAQYMEADLALREDVTRQLSDGKINLTKRPTESNIVNVQSLWPSLKRRLQSASAETGKKSELAKLLKVDLTIISRWLTDKKSAREPGAEYTLQMLHWVEQRERQK
jgi:transcriptional regulator with XRE-family HTH domain